MSKNKKFITAVVAVVVAVLLFVAGYLLSGKLFPAKTDTDAQEQTTAGEATTTTQDNTDSAQEDEATEDEEPFEYLYILTDEKLGSGEIKVSKAEYEYYCTSLYSSLVSNAFQYDYYYGLGAGVQYTGFDWTKLPGEQKCEIEQNGKTFETYDDYIKYLAELQLSITKSCVEYAKLNSITLTEEDQKEIDASVQEIRESCEAEGYDLVTYFKKFCGEEMTEEIFINIITERYILNKVDYVKDELLYSYYYTNEMIEDEYNANKKLYGQVTMRNYIVVAAKDASGAVYEASMNAAKKEADVFADLVTDEKSFIVRASEKERKNNNEKYAELLIEDSYTLLKNIGYEELGTQTSDEDFADWAFDPSRKAGDVYVAEIDGTGYGVYMITEPVHKPASTYTYDVRHVLVKFPEEGEKDTSTKVTLLDPADYDVTVDINIYPDLTADHALYMKAQGLLEEYLAGECTEESFSMLALQHSADSNATQGGIYRDVYEGDMVSSFENWALEKYRKAGDVGIVESVYGYHIMYFVGREELTNWESAVKENMVVADIDEFVSELSGSYTLSVEAVEDSELQELYKGTIKYYEDFIAGLQ